MAKDVLEVKELRKSFFGVQVLNNVSLNVREGEVHALLGENGAGKSTLVKIISGAYKRDSGTIKLDGRGCYFKNPSEAYNNGIGIIYQDTSLINEFTVLENIFLGLENRAFGFFISTRKMLNNYKVLCDKTGFYIDPDIIVKELSIAEKKIVEIMKCLVRKSKIVIMDEPTDALTEKESDLIFSVIKDLVKRDVSVIYITHYLSEVFKVADRVTVLKDGICAGTVNTSDVDEQKLVSMIVDKDFKNTLSIADSQKTSTQEVLRVENISYKEKLKNVSFSLYKGEILGITGLIGAGKTELAMILFGALKMNEGDIFINNIKVVISSPFIGKKSRIGLLTDDRDRYGLIHNMSVVENFTLPSLGKHLWRGLISVKSEHKSFCEAVDNMNLKTTSTEQDIETLSGGNKQKIIIGKWLETEPDILIMDEPTRGIDLKTKLELYKKIRELSDSGKSIIFISTEIPELIGLSDRILVMKKGRVQEICSRDVTEEEIYNKIFRSDSHENF